MGDAQTVSQVHVRRSWRAILDEPGEAEALARLFAQSQTMRGHRSTDPRVLDVDAKTAVLHPRALQIIGSTERVGVTCRAATTDAEVFDDTFVGLYHLPPEELEEDAVVLDLGGNVGYTAAHFAVMAPRGRVICVEMDSANGEAARKNLAQFGDRCTIVHAAAWSRAGEVVYEGTEAWGYRIAVLDGMTPTPSGERTTLARAMTVESMLDEAGVECVDYAKVDIEGAEAEIVTADAAWLKRVRAIKVEYHEPATRESMAKALQSHGFGVRDDDKHTRCVVGVRKT